MEPKQVKEEQVEKNCSTEAKTEQQSPPLPENKQRGNKRGGKKDSLGATERQQKKPRASKDDPNAEAIEAITEMGYTKATAKKALKENAWNVELAIEWIMETME